MAAMIKPEQAESEIILAFHDWVDQGSGQRFKVDGKDIEDDPHIGTFGKIGSLLTDEDLVRKAMIKLNDEMIEKAPKVQKLANVVAKVVSPQQSALDAAGFLKAYYKNRAASTHGAATKAPELGHLLDSALRKTEAEHKFNKTIKVLTKAVADQEFLNLLLTKSHWKDPGVGAGHGEWSHRLQWYVICSSGVAKPASDAFERIGKWYGAGKNRNNPSDPVTKVSLWDALCDRASRPTNQFAPAGALDFRSPENFHAWLVKAENEAYFPVLHAYLVSRKAKRGTFDVQVHDYVAGKLYGKSYKNLMDSERRVVCGHLDGVLLDGDGIAVTEKDRNGKEVGVKIPALSGVVDVPKKGWSLSLWW